jgi:CrcB protein
MTYFWVALGGALGSVARLALSLFLGRRFGEGFPWGTIFVNVTGSFLIGVLAALSESGGKLAGAAALQRFLIVGVCGGFTTFSAFSIQTLDLARSGHAVAAGLNVLLSVALCLIAVWCGHLLGTALRGN